MLNFLAPAALAGLLLLAIPILVHIFKPRKMKQTPFSSLRWLRQTQQRLSRRVQFHQLLLFLLRAGFIVLLVLALAQPLLGTGKVSRHTDRYIVVDVSRSMAYQAAGRPTPLEKAKEIAATLVKQGRSGDRTALLLTGSGTRLVSPPVVNAEAHLPGIETATVGFSDTNLSSALAVIRPLLAQPKPDTDVELYFLTDNHQQSWSQGEVAAFTKDLPVPVRVRLVDVGVGAAPNAWIADARILQAGGRRVMRIEARCVGDTRQERTLHVSGITGLSKPSAPITLEPGALTPVDVELPPSSASPGQVAHIHLEPPDALPSDDHFYLNLGAPAALRIVLVVPEATEPRPVPPGLHLRTAVEALTSKTNQALDLVERSAAAVTPRDFADADVIVLAGVPDVPGGAVEALEKRVQAGAGLIVFLGDTVRPEFYNTKLYRELQPADGLVPVKLGAVVKRSVPAEPLAALTGIRWSHRLLAPLQDPMYGELAQAGFGSYYRFGTAPGDNDTVLAWLDDTVPAVIEHPVGAGKVLLFNTTANDDWGDLPRRKSYVPLVDRLLNYLSGGGIRRSFVVGDPVTLPLADWQNGETVAIVTPDGSRRTPTLANSGGRTVLRLDGVDTPGVYQVDRPANAGKNFAFTVNVGPGDSVLTAMDTTALARWWEPQSFEVVTTETLHGATAASAIILWPWLLGLAAVLLLLEMFFVHWMCPRANPTLAEVVVHKRGLLKPMSSTESV
jgi:hypothetical protein